MIADSLSIENVQKLNKDEVVMFYQTLLQQQSDNYSNIINLLMGITTILVGSSVIWNFLVSKNQIKNEIILLSENLKNSMTEYFDKAIEQKSAKIQAEIDSKIKTNEGHLARLYAISAGEAGFTVDAVRWWIDAIKAYRALNDDFSLRICVNSLIAELEVPKWTSDSESKFDADDAIEAIKSSVPSILSNERDSIIKKLKIKLKERG